MLKSAELTGSWEAKLKEIEKGAYPAGAFIKQMKSMVDQLVYEVRSDHQPRSISSSAEVPRKKAGVSKKNDSKLIGMTCPKCETGTIIKGSKAYGCTGFKNGCDFLLPFHFMDKKISENQYLRLVKKSETVDLKGFVVNGQKTKGKIHFDEKFKLKLQAASNNGNSSIKLINTCPKCGKGELIKGKNAYGCSYYHDGCDFTYPYDKLRSMAQGKPLTAELAMKIITGQ